MDDELPENFRKALAAIVGEQHVLADDAAAGFSVDWTGRFQGRALAVVRPRDTAEVAAVLTLCTDAGRPVVPQGGNTGLVGVPVGSRVMLVVPPKEGYGKTGQKSAGIKGTDTLVFVIDILATTAAGKTTSS